MRYDDDIAPPRGRYPRQQSDEIAALREEAVVDLYSLCIKRLLRVIDDGGDVQKSDAYREAKQLSGAEL